jgi:hypothetical protein
VTEVVVEIAIVVLLVLVGVTQCLPGLLAVTPERIPAAYGVTVEGPDLALLLRHRAVLLALPGVLVLVSAGVADLRWAAVAACAACAASMASFVVLLALTPGVGRESRRVAAVDVVAVVALVAVAVLMLLD